MADGRGDGAHVGGVVVVVVDEVDRHVPAHLLEGAGDGVGNRSGGGAGALRIQWKHDQLRASLVPERAQRVLDGRAAVAHGMPHGHRQAFARKRRLKPLLQLLMRDRERRALVRPDARVLRRRRLAALRQDEQMQDKPPAQTVHGRNAPVHEELRQVRAHRTGTRLLGSPGVHHENAERIPSLHVLFTFSKRQHNETNERVASQRNLI